MRIDTSRIEGFEEMTPEEKILALTEFEYEVPEDRTQELARQKELIDKYSSEIASLKKEAKKGLDENERARQETEELLSALKSENEALKRSQTVANLKASYVAMGYDEKLAEQKAEAFADGDVEKVLSCENKFRESIEKAIRADLIKGTPHPDDKGSSVPRTAEDIMKIEDPVERQEAIADNIELFT